MATTLFYFIKYSQYYAASRTTYNEKYISFPKHIDNLIKFGFIGSFRFILIEWMNPNIDVITTGWFTYWLHTRSGLKIPHKITCSAQRSTFKSRTWKPVAKNFWLPCTKKKEFFIIEAWNELWNKVLHLEALILKPELKSLTIFNKNLGVIELNKTVFFNKPL